MPSYVLYHKRCGHVAVATGIRENAERAARNLIEAGYSQWRVRVATDADLLTILGDEPDDCDTCRIAPPPPNPDAPVAVMPMACLNDPDEIKAARQRTHDDVIELCGDRRRSGVRWVIPTGHADCTRLMRDLYPDSTPGVEKYFEFFDQYPDSCALVVAMCETEEPTP